MTFDCFAERMAYEQVVGLPSSRAILMASSLRSLIPWGGKVSLSTQGPHKRCRAVVPETNEDNSVTRSICSVFEDPQCEHPSLEWGDRCVLKKADQ